jgi:hypothetical protein
VGIDRPDEDDALAAEPDSPVGRRDTPSADLDSPAPVDREATTDSETVAGEIRNQGYFLKYSSIRRPVSMPRS